MEQKYKQALTDIECKLGDGIYNKVLLHAVSELKNKTPELTRVFDLAQQGRSRVYCQGCYWRHFQTISKIISQIDQEELAEYLGYRFVGALYKLI